MRNYVILSLVCVWLGGALACRMSLNLDSQQQWVFGEHNSIGLLGTSHYLCMLTNRDFVLFRKGLCKWNLSNGVITREGYRQRLVVTVRGHSIRGEPLRSPPSPYQLFTYVNGTIVNPTTGLLLTQAHVIRTKLAKPAAIVKRREVIHLMNEKWYLEEGKVVSAWNGLVLTRKQGDPRLYTLPYNQTDK